LEDANNENASITAMAALELPQTVQVLPTQNHAIHIESHLNLLRMLNQALDQQQMPLEKAIPLMQPVMDHTLQHLQELDPTDPQKGAFVSTLKQAREVVSNGAKEIFANQQKMQKEMEHNGPQSMGPENENPEAQQALGAGGNGNGSNGGIPQHAALVAASAKLEQELSDLHTDRSIRIAEFERKQAREDALAAAKIQKLGLPPGIA
jgi:hypothetical protein